MAIPLHARPRRIYRLAIAAPGSVGRAERRLEERFYVTEPDPATGRYRISPEGTRALAAYLRQVGGADPERPQAVPVRLVGMLLPTDQGLAAPEDLLYAGLAWYTQRGRRCHSLYLRVKDEEEARADNLQPPLDNSRMAYLIGEAERLVYDEGPRPVLRGRCRQVCNPLVCPQFQGGECKPEVVFRCRAPWAPYVGPWVEFRSTSYRSYLNLVASLRDIGAQTGGWVHDLDLWLHVSIERTGRYFNPVVDLRYHGTLDDLMEHAAQVQRRWLARQADLARLAQEQRALHEGRVVQGLPPEEERAYVREFYPEAAPDAPPEPPPPEPSPEPHGESAAAVPAVPEEVKDAARVLYQHVHGPVSEGEWLARTRHLVTPEDWQDFTAQLEASTDAAADTGSASTAVPPSAPAGPAACGPALAPPLFRWQPGDPLDSLPTPGEFAQRVLRALGPAALSAICRAALGRDRPGDCGPDEMERLIQTANRWAAPDPARLNYKALAALVKRHGLRPASRRREDLEAALREHCRRQPQGLVEVGGA